MSEEVNVVVIHYPKPERIQEFRDLVLRVKNTFKHSPGTIGQHAFEVKNAEGGPEIVVTERYKDHASLEKVVSSDEFKEISKLVIELVRQPPRAITGTPLPGVEESRT
ncbi:putative quinol monooxygenase [Aspergillus puulaauensis]|uniref:ABM domain-containing protein n=1 Tax=Aspergillus puulaauensis TaxID=1220207 RepID=A0A7R8AR23_9EURO|nr:uncharacterized protein APUU_61064S [Aspergillus puulaauensis]BCS28016.1 hypothetical protein APUU_61064S [Aspergillus puulaauensis]